MQEVVTASWERLLAATAAIDAFRAEVRANQIALEGVQQEALVGARTVLDVLDAEQELFDSQVSLVRAGREEVLASYQLKLAVGQLTVDGLELPTRPSTRSPTIRPTARACSVSPTDQPGGGCHKPPPRTTARSRRRRSNRRLAPVTSS